MDARSFRLGNHGTLSVSVKLIQKIRHKILVYAQESVSGTEMVMFNSRSWRSARSLNQKGIQTAGRAGLLNSYPRITNATLTGTWYTPLKRFSISDSHITFKCTGVAVRAFSEFQFAGRNPVIVDVVPLKEA